MPSTTPLCVSIFISACQAIQKQQWMTPRSANDKEYFPQDWFLARLSEVTNYVCEQSGRNSYPDFWVSSGNQKEGYEIKSLAFANGRPARKDIDFNSTIPLGKKGGNDVFLVFFLYTGSGANPRPIHSLVIAHADIINSDHELADSHENHAIRGFGSYGDGFIRDRKMYVLPHPLTIYPQGLGKATLIVPSAWNVNGTHLKKSECIERIHSSERLRGYTIDLWGSDPTQLTETAPASGQALKFDVFEYVP